MQTVYVIKGVPRSLSLKGIDQSENNIRLAIYTNTKKNPEEAFVFDDNYNITIDTKLNYGMYIYAIELVKLDKVLNQIGFGYIEVLPNIIVGD